VRRRQPVPVVGGHLCEDPTGICGRDAGSSLNDEPLR
jgi:hypothetical protein